MNKKVLLIPIGLIIAVVIAVSGYLLSLKPNTANVDTAHKIAEYSKPAVVIIATGFDMKYAIRPKATGTDLGINEIPIDYYVQGSGALISSNGYIVTNAHVVQIHQLSDATILMYGEALLKDILVNKFKVDPANYEWALEDGTYSKWLTAVLPGGKAYDADVKSYGAPVGEGKDVAVIKIDGTNFPSLRLGDSTGLSLQDSVWICGFPVSGDSSFLSINSQLVATINSGKISAIDKQSRQGSPIIQVDGAATHGNSGGPVVAENGRIIGLLTFGGNENPITKQQPENFSFVVPVSTVKEFVNQSGANNDDSDVNKMYKRGLELYWGGYYKDALGKFEDVKRLFPIHSEVQKYITECQTKSSQSKILWSNYTVLFIIFDFIIIALLILAGVIIITRGKSQVDEDNGGQREVPEYEENNKNNERTMYQPQVKPSLYCASGLFKGTTFELDKGQTILGRDPNVCQIIFPKEAANVSRKHCTIYYDNATGNFVLIDNNSSYGTFLDEGEKLVPEKPYQLKSGKRFYLSDPSNLFEVRLGR